MAGHRERDPSVKVCTKIKLACAYGIQEPLAVSADVSYWCKELLPTAWYSEFHTFLSIRQFRRNGWREREFRPMTCVVSNLPMIRRSFGELMKHLFVKIKDHFPLKKKTGFFSSTALSFPYKSWRLIFFRWATPSVTFTLQKIAVLGVRWSGLQHLNLPFWGIFLCLEKKRTLPPPCLSKDWDNQFLIKYQPGAPEIWVAFSYTSYHGLVDDP